MTVLLVRHARAGSRKYWKGPDIERPLSKKGRRQAEGLVDMVSRYPIKRILSSPYVRCVQTVEQLSDPPRPEELHQVRIRAKRCRYASEAVAPAVGKEASRFASAVAEVQGVLGDHHDAYVADQWLRDTSAELDAPQVLAAGELISLQMLDAARLEQEWQASWKKASKKSLRRWLG